MNLSELKIINIKDQNLHNQLWNDCLTDIKNLCTNDSLYENYINIDLDNFLYFTGLVLDNKIISFGGIDQRFISWGKYTVRALSKFWIHPKYRTLSLTKWRDSNFKFSPFILHNQLDFIRNLNHIKAVIITREGNYGNSFKEIIRLANTVADTPFQIMPHRYNVCDISKNIKPSCWQFLATNNIDHFNDCREQGLFKIYE